MKVEIEKSEYDRLKSREEKLFAYYGWFVDKENDLATVEDIVNENIELHNTLEDVYKEKRKLEEENRKLKSDLDKFSEAYKRYRDYEKEELAESCYDLARENEKLKVIIKNNDLEQKADWKHIEELEEENKKIKADYIKLSKIVETTGGYKASYVNELRDKIAKLEFDIEARIKLKAVREDKERILNKEIMGLRDQKYNHGEPVVSSGPCFVGGNIS